ncbi:hypothetical protein PG997_015094 [Apiospora hydei]|uniref:Uncharacterized protein n=1 Tax=Apiospora hydei TaxID=1337664 RepID=A0ABR1UVS4_9PEZI
MVTLTPTFPTLWCTILLLFPVFSSQDARKGVPGCEFRSDFVKRLTPVHFDPTQNCGELNFILQAVNKNRKYDYCSADPQHVLGYIRDGFRPAHGGDKKKMPQDCEIEQWWFKGHYPRSPVAFCKNATAIAATRDKKVRFNLTRAQPFFNVIHGPRTTCHDLVRNDLETIGNPDVAGPGLLLCAFFSGFYRDDRSPRRAELSFSAFYTTTMMLALSIAVASAVTFAETRATPSSIRSDLRLPNIYEYRLLALAPAFAVLPVMVAHTLHHERQQQQQQQQQKRGVFSVAQRGKSRRKLLLLLPRVLPALVCLLCVVMVWVIWVVGEQGRKSPVRFVFGGRLDIRVSGFLYTQAGEYTLAVVCLTTALPVLGILLSTWIPHRGVYYWRQAGSVFRVVCLLLALVEWIMLMFIRTKAVEDGQGHTSETEIGFGQILALFTWFPVLFILAFGVEFPGLDGAKP